MAYRDPEKLRKHPVKILLTKEENTYLESLAVIIGEQKSSMVRGMLMDQIHQAHQHLIAREEGEKRLIGG